MKKTHERFFGLLGAAALLALGSGSAIAGGLVDTGPDAFDAADFTNSEFITNPWWTLTAGDNFLYFSESDDGCEWNLVEVQNGTTNNFGMDNPIYAGINARIVLDRSWLDEDCSEGDAEAIADYGHAAINEHFADVVSNFDVQEQTYDWFAQDTDGNIWYMGEDTFNGEDHSGSFTAGCDGAEAGIVILGDPSKGAGYKQEYYEDEAEDWGKVSNFIGMEDQECMKTKEWSPLEHGAVEHKFYCHDDPAGPGELLLINELQGKTVVQELIDRNVTSPAGPPTDDVDWQPQCPPYAGPPGP